jgi:Uma2 family endonuclease
MKPMSPKKSRTTEPEPTWGIAHLFPLQGAWSVREYFALNGNHLVEYVNGRLEVLPMPTTDHQMLVAYLYGLLLSFVTGRDLGVVLFAPLRIKVGRRKFREPDVVFMHKSHADRISKEFWKGADLVMEVVSEGQEARERDLVEKRQEYAEAGIREYWIIDPQEGKITVLRLAGKQYAVHGEFPKGTVATSHLLPGFAFDVSTALAQHTATPTQAPKKPKRPRRP